MSSSLPDSRAFLVRCATFCMEKNVVHKFRTFAGILRDGFSFVPAATLAEEFKTPERQLTGWSRGHHLPLVPTQTRCIETLMHLILSQPRKVPMSNRPIVLIDMDGVLAQFEHRVIHHWQQTHPELPHVPLEKRQGYDIVGSYPKEHHGHLEALFNRPGLFDELEPEPGCVEAVKELAEFHAEVFFCSKPTVTNPTCHSDKNAWIARHFGPSWCKRLILTSDKTLVHGDILIDDKPEVTGIRVPSWRHVMYRTYHNRHIDVGESDGETTACDTLEGWPRWKSDLSAVEDEDGFVILQDLDYEVTASTPYSMNKEEYTPEQIANAFRTIFERTPGIVGPGPMRDGRLVVYVMPDCNPKFVPTEFSGHPIILERWKP